MNFGLDGINPVEAAKDIIKRNPVILDTETTGLARDDEIVEIAAIDIKGGIYLDTLIKPKGVIGSVAYSIHGINTKDVNDAPTFDIIWNDRLADLIANRPVCYYNDDFDLRLISQSLEKYGIKFNNRGEAICIMRLYAKFVGIWDVIHWHYKWFKLVEAARRSNLTVPENFHRALADAELTRKLLVHIASQ